MNQRPQTPEDTIPNADDEPVQDTMSEATEHHEAEEAQLAPEPPRAARAAPSTPVEVKPDARRVVPREALRRAAPPAAATPASAGKPQPSWVLSATGEHLTREELLARYRRQRSLPDDPFEAVPKPVATAGQRERILTEPRPAARFIERPAPDTEAPPPAPRGRSFTLGQTFAIAAGMALVASAGAGVLSARLAAPTAPAPVQALATAPAAEAASPLQPVAQQLQVAQADGARSTTIEKKPVSTATLQVADVAGETNSFIPLALHAEPAGLDKDMLLKISGIPEGAYLTSGHREEDQVWSLSLAEVKNVKLVVPQAREPQIDLAVAAFEPKTGELAAPVKTMTVALKDVQVEPTSGPPPGQVEAAAPSSGEQKSTLPAAADAAALPAAIQPPDSVKVALATSADSPETQQLVAEGDQLFKSGDVRAARKSYERAWGNDGSAAAAFGLGRSYDPVVVSALALKNAKPDKAQALQWYQRAASAGNPDAAEAIVRLQLKP